jgi:hypothetical protein
MAAVVILSHETKNPSTAADHHGIAMVTIIHTFINDLQGLKSLDRITPPSHRKVLCK